MGELVRLSWPLHAHHVCQRLWHLLREDFSTDFELSIKDNEEDCVDQPSIRVHRLIISAVCPLFKQYMGDKILFSNRQNVDFQEVNSLVEFIYRGKTTVTQESLPKLRDLANSMGLTVLVEVIDGLLGNTAKETEHSSSNSMVHDLGDLVKDKIRSKKWSMRWAMKRRDLFKCQHCSRGCDSQKDLENHLAAIHHLDIQGNIVDKTLKCPKCRFTCYAMFQLSKHRREKHRDRTPLLKCNKCQFVCSNDAQLSRHLETLHAHESLIIDMQVINLAEDSTCDDAVAEDSRTISENVPNKLQKSTSRIKKCNNTSSKKRSVKSASRRIKESFRCQNCPSRFQYQKDLLRHVVAVHHLDNQGNDLQKTIKCPKCDFTCYAMFQLKKHMRVKNHTGSRMLKCHKCDFVCSSHARLSRHLDTSHADDGIFKCSKCDHVSNNRKENDQHVSQHKDSRSGCDLDEMVSNNESALIHNEVINLGKDSSRDDIEDDTSEKVPKDSQQTTSRTEKCSNTGNRKRSVRWARRRKEIIGCEHCPRRLKSSQALDRHVMAIHHLDRKGNKLEKSIKCPKCDFTCYARFQLVGHMGLKMHNCARTFKCDKCNHTTHTRKEHEQHVRQHDDNGRSLAEMVSNNETSLNNTEEPEECSETGNKKSSARWERSSKRSFGCEYCPRWFKSQQELSRHVMGVHHLDSKGNQLEKTIKCSECDFTCYAMFQLQRHTAVTHRKNGPAVKKSRILKCDKCDFVCSSKVLLSRHLETVHSDGLFKSDQANLCVLTDVDLAKDSTRDNAVANEDNCVSENAPEQMQRTTPGIICSKTDRKKLGVRWETRIKGSFRCEHCNRGFKCDKDLFRHVVTIHHLGSQGGKLEKTIKCSKCDFTCHTRFQLKRHMRLNKNTRSHMVKCDKCDFVCRTEDMLSDHLETFHTDGIFECNICDHISHTRNELDQHVEQHIDNRSSCDLEEIVSNDESPLKDSVTEDQEHSATERARSLFVAALTRNSNVAINTITLTDDSISSRADKDKENEYVEDENDAEKEVVNDAKNDNDEKDSDNEEFEGDEKSSSSQTRDYEMEEDHEKIEDNIQDEGHLLRSGTLTFEEQTSNLEPISRSNPVSSESADEETSTTMEIVNGNENGDSSEKDLSDATISAQVEDGKITETVSSMDFICKRCTYSCDFNFALNRLLSSVHDSDTQLNKSEVNIKCPRCSYICYAMERVNSSESEVHISEASVLNCSQCDFLCFSSKELSRHQSRRHPPKWIGERWGAEVKGLSSSEIGKRAEVKGLSSSKIGKRDQRYRCHVCSKTYKYKACLVMHMEKMHQQPFANVVPSTDIVASTAINEAMSVSQDPEPSVIVLPCNLPSLIPESTVTTFSVANLVTTMDNSEDGLLNDHDYCSKLSPIYFSDSSIETGVDAAVELRVSSAEMIEANPSSFYSVLTLESLGDCLGIDSAEVPGEAAPKDMEDKDVCPDRLHQSCSSSENVTAVKTIEETDSTTCEKIEKIFQCKHCSYTSADRRYLIIHVMSKHEMDIEGNKLERSVKCPKCEFSCVKQFQLRRHDLAVHGGQIKCDKCSHTCSSEAEMIRHQGTFHDNYKPFKCDTCGFSCETRNSLDQHSTKHNSSKTSRFKRPKWGANLNGQVQLLRHMPNGGEQHSCNRCHRNFGSRYNLECHTKKSHRSDSDNKSAGPFTCDWCGRVSKNISSHDRHLKIFGHGRFMCEVCGVVVRHSITIDRHVKDQHTPGSEPQVCGVCHTACDTKWDLHLHMNKEHGVELPKFIRDGSRKKDGPPFNCDKCDYTTPNYRLYRKHEKWHNEPKRICQLCGKALKGLRALKRHMKRHENNPLNK